VPVIEYLEPHVVYENPRPHVHSRHGCFPGLVPLPSGELLALFVLAGAGCGAGFAVKQVLTEPLTAAGLGGSRLT